MPHLTYEESCNYLELPLLKDRCKGLYVSFTNQMAIDDHGLNDMMSERKDKLSIILENSLSIDSHYAKLIDTRTFSFHRKFAAANNDTMILSYWAIMMGDVHTIITSIYLHNYCIYVHKLFKSKVMNYINILLLIA